MKRVPQICNSAHEAARVARPVIPRRVFSVQECFVVLSLDAKNVVLAKTLIAMGTATSVTVHPRDVFREAVRKNAVGVIAVHNHPSGNTAPSDEDKNLTARLKEAGAVLGIPLLDHVILSLTGYSSMQELKESRDNGKLDLQGWSVRVLSESWPQPNGSR